MIYKTHPTLNGISVILESEKISTVSAVADYLYDNGITVIEVRQARAHNTGTILIYAKKNTVDSTIALITDLLNTYDNINNL